MVRNLSWRKVLPVLGVALFAAGIISAVAGSSHTSARGGWDNETKYFLKLAGVPGSATDNGHQGEIVLSSYRIMEDEPEAPSGEVTAQQELADNHLRFLANSSNASPLLFQKALSGDPIADAMLTVRKNGNDYLKLKMTDLMVTSYQNSGNDNNKAVDEVLLDYGTLEIEHTEGNTPLKKGWDFKKNREL